MSRTEPRTVARQCERCGKDFATYRWAVKKGQGRFCSNSCAARQHWSTNARTEGYRTRYLPDHPLADAHGIVREHRLVLYEKIGPGSHPCHWCEAIVTWQSYKDGRQTGVLVSDHVDGNVQNNDPPNLVPSCFGCNRRRLTHPKKMPPNAVRDDELFVVDSKGWRHRAARLTCDQCGTDFLRNLTLIRKADRYFCSNACSGLAKHGKPRRQAIATARSEA